MKFIVQDTFSIKKVLIFGGFVLCRFQHKAGMNSFPMRMNVISYGTNSFPWRMYSFRSKIPIGHYQRKLPIDIERYKNIDRWSPISVTVRYLPSSSLPSNKVLVDLGPGPV